MGSLNQYAFAEQQLCAFLGLYRNKRSGLFSQKALGEEGQIIKNFLTVHEELGRDHCQKIDMRVEKT